MVGIMPQSSASSSMRRAEASSFGPSFCPYSPECVEYKFCEVRILGLLRTSALRSSKKLNQEFIGNSSPLANKAGMTERA